MTCRKCGELLSDGARFCTNCGARVEPEESTTEYWWAYLFTLIASTAITIIYIDIGWLWSLITLVPNLSLAVRRMHDIGKSGWWLLIGFVPLVGGIILLIYSCRDSGPDNQWGPNPKY